MTILSAALLLFLVMDALGNVPIFIASLKAVDPKRQTLVVARELAIALVVMIGFLFLGKPITALLGISEAALSIAGGVILAIIALRMIFPRNESEDEPAEEPFIVPLAIPYVAGPSVLATEMLLMSREPSRWMEWLIALLAAWLASSAILFFASTFRRYLGRRGLVAIERLMGMVLITLAVQMVITGLSSNFAK